MPISALRMTLDWLSRDADTGAILLDIRRIKNHRLFLSAARAAAKLRPVVAIRAGLRLLDEDGAADLRSRRRCAAPACCPCNRLEDLLAAAETLSPRQAGPLRHAGDRQQCDRPRAPGRRQRAARGPAPDADDVPDHGVCACPPPIWRDTRSILPPGRRSAACWSCMRRSVRTTRRPSPSLCHPPTDLRAPVLVCAMGETTGAMHRGILARAGLPVFATPDQAVRGFERSGARSPQPRGGAGTARPARC